MKNHRPIKGLKVIWRSYNCIIQKLRYRDNVAKLVPDYNSGNTMPFSYYWVDFKEIGY